MRQQNVWIARIGGARRRVPRGTPIVETVVQDIGYAIRQFRDTPGFAAAVLANLAIGIGATVAIFSVVYGVLLRPFPYPTRDRLVRLSEEHPGARTPLTAQISNLTFTAWTAGGLRTLDRLAAYREDAYLIDFAGEPLLVSGADVSPDLFPLLGAVPAVGRFFAPDEATAGFDRVLVLSDRLWRNRFSSDLGVIDRQIRVWGEPYTIIGVARPDLAFPDTDTELWTPFVLPPPAGTAENPHVIVFRALGLLKPGATIAQAAAEGTAAARIGAVALGSNVAFGVGGAPIVRVLPIREAMTSVVRPALLLLSAGIGVVLLAVCANVVVLFLLRGASRQRELAVRAAIGAGTTRILRQLLTESLVLVTLGGISGVVVA
jgi:predicted permease